MALLPTAFLKKYSSTTGKNLLLQSSINVRGLISWLIILFPLFMSAQSKETIGLSKVYDEGINTVRFHKEGEPRSYPIFKLGGKPLTLSFDKFSRDVINYQYTIEHCTPDWQVSNLNSQIYLKGMQSAFIDKHRQSQNTYVNYINYELQFPNRKMQPKIPGNYVLKVFKNDNESEPVLTQRFFVASDKVNINTNLQQANFPQYRDSHQELDFQINYQGLENVSDPFEQFQVVVLQNGRTDNAIEGLKPKYIEGKTLIYDYEEENLFKGGNEFRPLDLRSLNFGGQGVRKLKLDSIYTAHLTVDENRAFKTHTDYNDNNGWNLILSANQESAAFTGAYISTYFYLDANPGLKEDEAIYVYGGLSNWQIQPEFKMEFLPDKGVYYTNVLLKQGYYDYKYAISKGSGKGSINTQRLEGSHFETENRYLVLVYFKDPFRNIFKLVGYQKVNSGIGNSGQ